MEAKGAENSVAAYFVPQCFGVSSRTVVPATSPEADAVPLTDV